MTYRIEILPSAIRELHKLPRPAFAKTLPTLWELVVSPRPYSAKAMVGEPLGTLRIRIGDYRVIYHIDDESQVVTICRIAHRREVYERLDH